MNMNPDHQRSNRSKLYGYRDCTAHVRSRSLYDRVTAVLPKHVEPFYLRRCLQQVRLNPLIEAQASISRVAHSILFIPLLSHGISLQRAETSSRLLLGLGIGYGGLLKHENVVGLIRSFVWSAGRTTPAFGALGRRDGMSLCYESRYRCTLDRISRL